MTDMSEIGQGSFFLLPFFGNSAGDVHDVDDDYDVVDEIQVDMEPPVTEVQ